MITLQLILVVKSDLLTSVSRFSVGPRDAQDFSKPNRTISELDSKPCSTLSVLSRPFVSRHKLYPSHEFILQH